MATARPHGPDVALATGDRDRWMIVAIVVPTIAKGLTNGRR
jgi:hypothetical protein